MLVCNISLRPARGAITVSLSEAGTAADVTTSFAAFARLVDESGSAQDSVNSFVGSFIIEAATAIDVVAVSGGTVVASLDELATAADVVTVISTYGAVIAETATADAAQDATKLGAVTTRSTMLPGMFINSDTSREAYVDGVMVNQ